MKTLVLALVAAIAAPQTAGAAPAANATVTIDLGGLRPGSGALYVSLQTREEFMQPRGSYGTIIAQPTAGSVRVPLAGVKAGTYAASLWHDVNGNKKWDENDGWAMLNGDALRDKPTFDQVSFAVDGKDRTLMLNTRYGYGR